MPSSDASVQALRQAFADGLAKDFGQFARYAFQAWRPHDILEWASLYDCACEHLQDVAERKCRRLIWNHPPRLLKSFLFSIAWPAWVWTWKPHETFLFASCSMPLSQEFSIARRALISSAWYQTLWGNKFRLSADQNRLDSYSNNQGGAMTSVSVGTDTIGRGGSVLVADDLLTPEAALSDAERKATNRWLFSSFLNRINNSATGAVVLVAQRLHVDDPTAALMEAEPGVWTHVKHPLVAEEDLEIVMPRSNTVWRRPADDVLLPSRFPQQELESRKKRFYEWASQSQQEPCSLEGNLLKASHVRYYSSRLSDQQRGDACPPQRFDQLVISADTALRTGSSNDPTAVAVVGTVGRLKFVLDMWVERAEMPRVEAAILERRRLFPGAAILIEGRASGDPIVQRLKSVLQVSNVHGIDPKGSKPARFVTLAAEFAAGDWLLPRDRPWTEALLAELLAFPGKHDDQADALSQACLWLLDHSGGGMRIMNIFTGEDVTRFATVPWHEDLGQALRESEEERKRQAAAQSGETLIRG